MLAVTQALPDGGGDRPPVVLVHGAANSAAVWTHWQRELAARGYASYAIDLRGHGCSDPIELSQTSMHDYADDVRASVRELARTVVLAGWSMGGLVALMVAAGMSRAESARTAPKKVSPRKAQDISDHQPIQIAACIGLAPSMPARAADASVALRAGEFGAEEYGITSADPDDQPAMPDLDRQERATALASLGRESRLARDERQAGIVVQSLPCPLLIATGTADTQWPRERYDDLWLAAEQITVEGASHWGLVLNRRALATLVPAVVSWIERVTA